MKLILSGIPLSTLISISNFYYSQHYWIKNINIINVENGEVLKNQHVKIEKGKIVSIVEKVKKVKSEIINGQGKYLIPGLWDMHVHLDMVGEASMPLFLNYGITGVRDMGGDINVIKKYKKQPEIPTIISAGAILESPRFYQIVSMLLGEEVAKSRVPFGDPTEAGQLVDSLVASGSDFIKIRTDASQEVFEALGRACKERGVTFSGHIDRNIDFMTTIKSGIGSI
ncbi:hypothetical protein BH23BAC1_BH23BAC1_51130 [soil metagenome]